MASITEVKDYVAQWLQLGKHLQIGAEIITIQSVWQCQNYSPEYETLWQKISAPSSAHQTYLNGVEPSIEDLLSPRWQIIPCYRCHGSIPTPLFHQGNHPPCPCADLPDFPNVDLVMPHPPIDNQARLQQVADRIGS